MKQFSIGKSAGQDHAAPGPGRGQPGRGGARGRALPRRMEAGARGLPRVRVRPRRGPLGEGGRARIQKAGVPEDSWGSTYWICAGVTASALLLEGIRYRIERSFVPQLFSALGMLVGTEDKPFPLFVKRVFCHVLVFFLRLLVQHRIRNAWV